MITLAYCREMARYNAWQNAQLREALQALAPEALTAPRGAFFGSILGTASHLLWGDAMWMARLDGQAPPGCDLAGSVRLVPDLPAWSAARGAMDARIGAFAEAITPETLAGDLEWHSGATGRDMVMPRARCIVHMFNHQTHHRGQIHAMLTAAGGSAPVSDLIFGPAP